MKVALLVGTPGSDDLFFLRTLTKSENSKFSKRRSKDFKNVTFFSGKLIEKEGDETVVILDETGEELRYIDNKIYRSKAKLWPVEIPQTMTFKNKKDEKTEESDNERYHQG